MKNLITSLAIAMLVVVFVSNAQVDSTSQSGSVDSTYTGGGNGVDSSDTDRIISILPHPYIVDSTYTGGGNGVDSSYTWSESAIFNYVTCEEVPSGLNISWHSDSTNYSYCVQVATDVAFTNIITNVSNLYTNSHEVDSLRNDSTNTNLFYLIDCQLRPVSTEIATYYWRVGATDVNSNTTWSAKRVKTVNKTTIINGLESKFASSTVSVYPNPSSDVLYVTGSDAASVELLDVNGVSVLSANGNAAAKGLNVANVAAGIYVLKVNQGSEIKTFRIIKQ
jgi:hypothetical protein